MAKKKTKLKLTTGSALIIAIIVLVIVIAFGASGQTAKFFAAPGGVFTIKPICGNGKCEPPNENLQTCQQDCAVCGDGVCSRPTEDGRNCLQECLVCGDGICDAPEVCATSNYACNADCKVLLGDGICMANLGEAQNSQDCAVCGDGICASDICGFVEKCNKDCFCTDSDNGINLNVLGTCTDAWGKYKDTCSLVSGKASNKVWEYYCDDFTETGTAYKIRCWTVEKTCPEGNECRNGKCTPKLIATNLSSPVIR